MNLNAYQLKIDCYRHRMIYINLIVTTNQKSAKVQKNKEKRKPANHKRREKKGTQENYKNNQKAINKIHTVAEWI